MFSFRLSRSKDVALRVNTVRRFLQGWDEDIRRGPGTPPPKTILPHRTILPGLQFTLAGILGKPATFYEIPIVRFAFSIFQYS